MSIKKDNLENINENILNIEDENIEKFSFQSVEEFQSLLNKYINFEDIDINFENEEIDEELIEELEKNEDENLN